MQLETQKNFADSISYFSLINFRSIFTFHHIHTVKLIDFGFVLFLLFLFLLYILQKFTQI